MIKEIKFTTENIEDFLDAFDYIYEGRDSLSKEEWLRKKVIEYMESVVRKHKIAAEKNKVEWTAIEEANKINIK